MFWVKSLNIFQSVREEEETAATEKAEIEMEEEKNRLTIELENEQRVTLGMEFKLQLLINIKQLYTIFTY